MKHGSTMSAMAQRAVNMADNSLRVNINAYLPCFVFEMP